MGGPQACVGTHAGPVRQGHQKEKATKNWPPYLLHVESFES